MKALALRHPRAAGAILSVVGVLLGVALAAACAAAVGCGGAAQRTVSALAVAAVEADRANATAYEIIAQDTMDDVQSEGGDFALWCRNMATPWERCSTAECAIEALADLAIAGQHVVDAGDDLNGEWLGAACETLRAIEAAWTIAEDPPAALATARGLVCGFADGARSEPPECADPGPPPPCP